MLGSAQSALGIVVLMAMAWLFSENRHAAQIGVTLVGVALQVAIAAALLQLPPLRDLFGALNSAVLALQQASEAGSTVVFGYLGGGPLPFEEGRTGGSFILAFRALPLVIVISALTAVLSYWRVLPLVTRALARVLEKTLGIGGAVALGTAANVFVGMVEAPLFIRDHIGQLSRSELFTIMCAGMATIAGTVLVLYATILQEVLPDVVGHLLTASIISVPAAITIARLMVPQSGGKTPVQGPVAAPAHSTMDALTAGTQSGLQLYLNIVAMLLVFVALVHLLNACLGVLPPVGGTAITVERLLGYAMAPLAWLMGVPREEALTAGALLGTKTVLNEFLAYLDLAALPQEALSARSRTILTYALCGFANLGSLGIMVGGLCTIAPERRAEILQLGPRSIVGGTLATCCTGAVVGLLTPSH